MKHAHIIIFSLLSSILMLGGCAKKDATARQGEVIVYAYDSFAGDWGAAPEIGRLFAEATGLTVTFVNCGDGVQVLSRALLEKDDPRADIVLGLDDNLAARAIDAGILEAYKPQGADDIIGADIKAQLCAGWELTPYDYSHFALIYDTRSPLPAPQCLEDLTGSAYRKKLILMDPRTSTPGLGFVAWTVAVFGDGYGDYWRRLKDSILTMAPGWSAGYGLFTNGEAPLVISYATSPAASITYDGIDYYKALVFDEGHPLQVEGAGLLKGAPNKAGAQQFLDFLISEAAQAALPLTQWMYPVNKAVVLPPGYAQGAVVPAKTVRADAAAVQEAVQTVMAILGD